MNMWIYTIEPSLEIIQFEASETRGEHKVAYSVIIYVGFKLPKWPRRPVWPEHTYTWKSYFEPWTLLALSLTSWPTDKTNGSSIEEKSSRNGEYISPASPPTQTWLAWKMTLIGLVTLTVISPVLSLRNLSTIPLTPCSGHSSSREMFPPLAPS